MFIIGITSFTLVSILWVISSLIHRPIISPGLPKPHRDQGEMRDVLDEEQAAVTTATWTILHPPSSREQISLYTASTD